MTYTSSLLSNLASVGWILGAMILVAALEAVVPLRAQRRASRAHRVPNLALTAIAFATNALLGGGLALALAWLEERGFGLLYAVALPAPLAMLLVVVALDLAFYAAHVALHAHPALWRLHRVHHSDPAIDVTTTVRQHPGETLVRFAFLAAGAAALGASPAAFAIYRAASALNGLLEHANIRLPQRLDAWLCLVLVTPDMHKVHHSRTPSETDTNYGNILSVFDRVFSVFTPSPRGREVAYGLEGFDAPASQTTLGLLALPFRGAAARSAPAAPAAIEHA
jgi:sterol desaturase/sphingolipid hydroxylase (fatty acid hydroxylase superfamily)